MPRLSEIAGNLGVGSEYSVTFLAKETQLRDQKNKQKFMVVFMQDRSIVIEAKIFSISEQQASLMEVGKVYRASISVQAYSGSPTGWSVIVRDFMLANEEIAEDYRDRAMKHNENIGILDQLINSALKGSKYQELVTAVIEKYHDEYTRWPAASSIHHAYEGGLMEHSIEVAKIGYNMATVVMENNSRIIDSKLVVAASLLHDIGKVMEIGFDNSVPEYNIIAGLQTHIVLGARIVHDVAQGIKWVCEGGATEEDLIVFEHCILAHHGINEWGSPVTPAVIEAEIVHLADISSGRVNNFIRALDNVSVGNMETKYIGGERKNYYRH